jgi:hypothetical protein
MPRWKRMGFGLSVVAATVVAIAMIPGATSSGPGDRGTYRPEEAGSGATSDEKPGTGSSYWTEERMRNATPAQMPNPNR